MEMTFADYIRNPMGAKNAVLNATAREAIRSSYLAKFDAILVREKGRIDYRIYKNDKKNRYYIWFKIPSEVVEKFYYDVVIEFYADKDVEGTGNNLLDYKVKFFSNDPAFAYTYAYVFSHNGLFIDELKPKMSKLALKNAAKEKNPYNQVGYVKSIYFAYLTMINKGLNHITKVNGEASNIDMKYLLSQITDTDDKIEARQREGEKLKKKKASNPRTVSNPTPTSASSSTSKRSNGIRNTNMVKSTKTVTSSIKKTKRK